MSDERRDDEIIGRALSRAIETIDVNQTPYERSRIATAPARRSIFGLWQTATAVAAIVLAVAIGSWLTRPGEGQPGVAASPTAPSSPISSVAPAASAVQVPSVPTWVYFARDGLPPVGASVNANIPPDSRPESQISSRISALAGFASGSVPAGATNPMSLVAKPAPTGGSSQGSMGLSVRIQGDLATVEFDLSPGWGVQGAAQSQALLQQLVYTITEEPGIHRALITEKGKPNAVIDQLVVDKPLTREDVAGYTVAAPDKLEDGGNDVVADIVDWRASVDDVAPGLGRFVIELKPQTATQDPPMPRFVATLERPTQEKTVDEGKWVLRVALPDAVWNQAPGEAFHCCPFKAVGKTPIRRVAAYPLTADPPTGSGAYRGVGFAVILDDARPWRVAVLQNPLRLVVDVGGTPQAVSESIAVYAPRSGDTGRSVTISGFARVFEAHVAWRVKDSAGRIVGQGFTTASIGTSPTWGSFQTTATIPANVSGNVTLEVFWPSPKDGADMGLVSIPLTVR